MATCSSVVQNQYVILVSLHVSGMILSVSIHYEL